MFRSKMTTVIGIAGLACCALARAGEPAAETPAQALSRILDTSRTALTVSDQGLSGPGASQLVDAARRAEFILIGEDHGFADVPQFVLAMRQSLGKDAPENLVLEIGPLAAGRLADAARTGRLPELSQRYPAAIPFFDWSGDGAMARAFQGRQSRLALWGIDQEFILSTRMHLERLKALNAHTPASAAIDEFSQRARAAEARMMAEHDPAAALLPQLTQADFAGLRAALKPALGRESAQILDELARSAEIYRGQDTDAYASNHQRSLLMKRHFMAYYRNAEKSGASAPRAMFRLGAFHAARGASPLHQFDIGNLAAEIAASHDQSSVHLLVIAAGGTVNKWLPFMADPGLRAAPYNAREELEQLQAVSFIDHALPDRWTVFDLTGLRRSRAARGVVGSEFEQLIFGYDFVIVIPQAHAALDYPADDSCGAPGARPCRSQ